MVEMQSNDFEWFKNNLNTLFSKYGSRFVAIKNGRVIGVFDSYAEGVTETAKKEPLGSFIVQRCGKDESAYTNYISSMNFA